MKIWIRSLGGDVRDVSDADEKTALEAWETYDWEYGISEYDPEKDSPDHCRPAFGIKDGDAAAIDFTPKDEETCEVNLFCLETKKVFGLFNMQKNVHRHAAGMQRARIPELVTAFYAGAVDTLKAVLAEAKAGNR